MVASDTMFQRYYFSQISVTELYISGQQQDPKFQTFQNRDNSPYLMSMNPFFLGLLLVICLNDMGSIPLGIKVCKV